MRVSHFFVKSDWRYFYRKPRVLIFSLFKINYSHTNFGVLYTNVTEIELHMKIYDIISFNRELLQKLSNLNINSSDYQAATIYEQFIKLKKEGEKVSYITLKLAELHGCSQRTIYNIVNKMEQLV